MEPRVVINLDEPIGKVVGRGRPSVNPADLQNALNQAFTSQGHRLWPRGVYRFHSHAEADRWRQTMIHPKKVS